MSGEPGINAQVALWQGFGGLWFAAGDASADAPGCQRSSDAGLERKLRHADAEPGQEHNVEQHAGYVEPPELPDGK